MDAQEFAFRILESPDADVKLTPPDEALEIAPPRLAPGGSVPDRPARDETLRIVPGRKARVPSMEGWHDPRQRVRLLHALTNHEFQAVELFAWAFLRFEHAPLAFRRGLLEILIEEQEHTKRYRRILEDLGSSFGNFPVSGYFWNRTRGIDHVASFVSAMSLTFENANLDHTLELAMLANAVGDRVGAALFEEIHRDERRHVKFGLRWLPRLAADSSEGAEPRDPWDLYRLTLPSTLDPSRARGKSFHKELRSVLGFSEAFIEGLESESYPAAPGPRPLAKTSKQT